VCTPMISHNRKFGCAPARHCVYVCTMFHFRLHQNVCICASVWLSCSCAFWYTCIVLAHAFKSVYMCATGSVFLKYVCSGCVCPHTGRDWEAHVHNHNHNKILSLDPLAAFASTWWRQDERKRRWCWSNRRGQEERDGGWREGEATEL